MFSNLSRQSRQRRERLLIVGCGDVGQRVLRLLKGRWTVYALTSQPARTAELRALGAIPLVGNLDDPHTLARLAGLADRVLHLAPPPSQGRHDPRTRHLLEALSRHGQPLHLVYASTTGVYGDCGGARFDETRAVNPRNDRAWRRVDAEQQLRAWGRRTGCAVTVLRVPGIYALDREGGDPRDRVARGMPVLQHEDDVYTNHIHADDLARACQLALLKGRPQRILHASDSSEMRMGDYYTMVAEMAGLPLPQRIRRDEAAAHFSPMQMSFLGESRRLINRRLIEELGLKLRYPTPREALAEGLTRQAGG